MKFEPSQARQSGRILQAPKYHHSNRTENKEQSKKLSGFEQFGQGRNFVHHFSISPLRGESQPIFESAKCRATLPLTCNQENLAAKKGEPANQFS
jgi:hypothetical protein